MSPLEGSAEAAALGARAAPTGAVSEAAAAAAAVSRCLAAEDPASLLQPRRVKSAVPATTAPLNDNNFFKFFMYLFKFRTGPHGSLREELLPRAS